MKTESGSDQPGPIRARGALLQLNPLRRLLERAPRANGKSVGEATYAHKLGPH